MRRSTCCTASATRPRPGFRRLGITFYLYGDGASAEWMIPFDVLPRILSAAEWATVERGCIQRVCALNMFLHDIYHDQEILQAAGFRRTW